MGQQPTQSLTWGNDFQSLNQGHQTLLSNLVQFFRSENFVLLTNKAQFDGSAKVQSSNCSFILEPSSNPCCLRATGSKFYGSKGGRTLELSSRPLGMFCTGSRYDGLQDGGLSYSFRDHFYISPI
jgi:hypothetical protein